MRFTAINTSIAIDSKRILKEMETNKCELELGINAYIGEEVIDIIQKRLLSIGVFSSYTSTEIWFNQYKK